MVDIDYIINNADTIDKTIADYCNLLIRNNISVVAIDFITIFSRLYDYREGFQKKKLVIREDRSLFFTKLFDVLSQNNNFKIAVIIPLTALPSVVDDDQKALYDIVSDEDERDKYIKLKKYFNDGQHSNTLLSDPNFKKIIGLDGKINTNKIAAVISIRSYGSLFKKLPFTKTRITPEYVYTCAFIEDIFQIPICECMFIGNHHNFICNNSTFKENNQRMCVRIQKLKIHNFTNDDLEVYRKKFDNVFSNESEEENKQNIFSLIIMDETLLTHEQLYFAKCMCGDSYIVLTDNENKWEESMLYRARREFLLDGHVTTNIVAVSDIALS